MTKKAVLTIEKIKIIKDVSNHIINFINSEYNKKFLFLEEIDDWLIETEEQQIGVSKKIRQNFSNSKYIKEVISLTVVKQIEMFFQKKFILQDVIRLRTTMKNFDYLVSRPHQDSALWPTNPYFINAWIPLVNITKDLAPLCLYEEYLQAQLLPHTKNEYEQYEIVEKNLPKGLKKDIIQIHKGEMLLFSPSLIHHSMPNLTNKVRWSFDFRLIEEI